VQRELTIYWTDFHQILAGRYLIVDYGFGLFSRSLKGRCHGN